MRISTIGEAAPARPRAQCSNRRGVPCHANPPSSRLPDRVRDPYRQQSSPAGRLDISGAISARARR